MSVCTTFHLSFTSPPPPPSSIHPPSSHHHHILSISIFHFFFFFQSQIVVQAIDICAKTRNENGGMITLSDLTQRLQAYRYGLHQRALQNSSTRSISSSSSKKRPAEAMSSDTTSNEISEDDVLKAVKKIKVLGTGFQVIDVNSTPIVVSVPMELNTDHIFIVSKAKVGLQNMPQGTVSIQSICKNFSWTTQRAQKYV